MAESVFAGVLRRDQNRLYEGYGRYSIDSNPSRRRTPRLVAAEGGTTSQRPIMI